MAVVPRLEDFFAGAAGKILSTVEANGSVSNQHEFNGARALVDLLGAPPAGGEKVRFRTRYLYLDDKAIPLMVDGRATWYDARAGNPRRNPEHRFYYPAGNEVMQRARPGDYVVIAKAKPGHDLDLVVVVTEGGSSIAAQLEVMFGLEPSDRFDVEVSPSGVDLTFTSRQLLEALGYEVEIADDTFLDRLLERFGRSFPATDTFSAFARQTLPDVDARDDPDAALITWWEREEVLFRTFERHLLSERVAQASTDIDEVLRIAMSAFQRRRSRAGHALENHVANVLSVWGIPFDAQPKTEGKVRPDFVVPSAAAYHDRAFDAARLRMLAVKTTCKDRWRQILSEAARIPIKHLLTLEAPISSAQTAEMTTNSVVLVVPEPLHAGFDPSQRVTTVRAMLAEFVNGTGL